MKVTKYLQSSHIVMEVRAGDKRSVLESLVSVLVNAGVIAKEEIKKVVEALLEREALTSTGLCYGIALPHVKTDAVRKVQVVFGRNSAGVDFEALDGNPSRFFFLILAPPQLTDEYLKVVSAISGLMKDEKIRAHLLKAQTPEEIFKILDQNF